MPFSASWSGRAPGRVNLIGEHVDYMGGVVLPAAVDRFTDVSGHEAGEWSVDSEVAGGLEYVRAAGEELGAPPQAVTVRSQVPPNAGISSSAALLVATAAGLRPGMAGRDAALLCQRAEQKATGVRVGVMDQFASALGRRGGALLLDCATLDYQVVPFPDEVAIGVIDSGEHRSLAGTAYNERRREAEAHDPRRMRHVDSEIERVHSFVAALQARDFRLMGELLKLSHASLRDDQASDPGSSSETHDERASFHHPDRHYDHYYPAACPGGAEELIVSPVIQRAFRGRPGVGRPFCVLRRRPR